MADPNSNLADAARDALKHNPVGQRVVGSRGLNVPFVRKLSRKYFYPFISRRLEADDVTFLNWGYEEDPPVGLSLSKADEPNRYHINLYHRTATQAGTDLAGKDVLEISCGHGGGASYLTRTFKPASYTGLDFNPDGIAYCKKRHVLPGLDFVHGDAENLPFADASFDAVVNVEASHVYLDFSRFMDEVYRVLRPGGRMLYTDMRSRDQIAEWEQGIADAKLRVIDQRVIDAEVLRGLDLTADVNLETVTNALPALLRPIGRQIVVSPGSRLYRQLADGDISYRLYCFSKD
ncbi:SAM-dependent methyltransferase [Mycolicibacterium duvalii]|uniref:Phthiotriol/phenolphthiotriol dimycocerosates methyltransferase n=1 Tax=Mycolicibacterium duvalii TaxID=39688 RepID=A0A7I7JX74_9MYCO|nr:class I SAM-dependent methyltransferase [Mycolicibacterium duvalii]MCV7369712.1 class I SAM-dependent methyltransferase [Mycolicibacterium duvalii]PEG38002.1 SAM-dependent methyltransferase [Mycolicibacterium duvalii]BBX16440.1 phthiotriol/phenolphthiotriol dimycocerosates methyltransferase [Mycolicibacterium duvalii]